MHINSGMHCPTCAQKLLNCDSRIIQFVQKIQDHFSDCHVAIGYRDQADQHQALISGLSTFDWPHSKHNFCIGNKPCSRAVDLFCLGVDGKAYFLQNYYEAIWIWHETIKPEFNGVQYGWGGNYAHLKDFDHYELEDSE